MNGKLPQHGGRRSIRSIRSNFRANFGCYGTPRAPSWRVTEISVPLGLKFEYTRVQDGGGALNLGALARAGLVGVAEPNRDPQCPAVSVFAGCSGARI